MVSTRNHPTPLPAPSATPSSTPSTPTSSKSSPSPTTKRRRTPAKTTKSSTTTKKRSAKSENTLWTYTPTPLTVAWLLVSLPLVMWDMGYIFLRPYTFPGGALHKPFYTPYVIYEQVDKMYSVEAWERGEGFPAAQSFMNLIETAGYFIFLGVVWRFAEESDEERDEGWLATGLSKLGFGGSVGGGWGGVACLAGLALNVMTLSKTILYTLNDVFSGMAHTGHNDAVTWFFFWGIPNTQWIIFPSIIIYYISRDILNGLAIASDDRGSAPAVIAANAVKEE